MQPGAGESCEGSEGLDGFAVSGGEAAEVFELVEAAFDAVALFVEFPIVGALLFAIAFGRDDGAGAQAMRLRDQNIGVVASVGDDGFGLPVFQQLRSRRIFTGLPSRDAELQR